MVMDYVSHPLIKPNAMQSRQYQESVLASASKNNILCVLPTGLGKTPIAVALAARRLEAYPASKILILAPTRPLVNQHYKSFSDFLEVDADKLFVITGIIKPKDRQGVYKEKKIIFATPQTVENDLKESRLSLRDFSLLILDEVHHAVGGYAYPYIAKKYLEESENSRILGLTASPGGQKEKIDEICKNTGLEAVEIRTEVDEDVKPYVKEKEAEWIKVDLPENFDSIRQPLKAAYNQKTETLRKMGLLKKRVAAKKDLLALQNSLMIKIKSGNRNAFIGLSIVIPAIKIEHALGLLETQGIPMLENYWAKIRADTQSKYSKTLLNDKAVSNAMWLTNNLYKDGYKHPKISKLCTIINEELKKNPAAKIIVFASFRDTVKEVCSVLSKIEGARPVEFIGQGNRASKRAPVQEKKVTETLSANFQPASEIPINNNNSNTNAAEEPKQNIIEKGLTQKEQMERLERFKSGACNILVCTSIGEEGLHISDADTAIFYEPVPSEIRSIQRRGRVGRSKVGRVITLMTKGTRDEAYYWSSLQKEKRMKGILYSLQAGV